MIWETPPDQLLKRRLSASYPNFLDWRKQNNAFVDLAGFFYKRLTIEGASYPEQVRGALVTADFFSVLGRSPTIGRTFDLDEQEVGKGKVVVLSHGFWTRSLGSRPDVIGSKLAIDGQPHTVIGVMPTDFHFRSLVASGTDLDSITTELWIPFAVDVSRLRRSTHLLQTIGRLKSSFTLELARQDMDVVANRLKQAYPRTNGGVRLIALKEAIVGSSRKQLLMLLCMAALIQLIVCTTVANMFVSQAVAGKWEIAIRASLGAGTKRLLRQSLLEGMIVAGIGCALGLLLSYWGTDLLKEFVPDHIPRKEEISIDLRVLSYSGIMTIVAGLFFGLLMGPALSISTAQLVIGFLYGVLSTDPTTFGAAGLLLGLVGGLASYLPARRASRMNPIDSLRCV